MVYVRRAGFFEAFFATFLTAFLTLACFLATFFLATFFGADFIAVLPFDFAAAGLTSVRICSCK